MSHEADRELKERARSRLERLYLATLHLRRDVNLQLANATFALKRGISPEGRPAREVPPLFELEMLVELYFGESLRDGFAGMLAAAEDHVNAYLAAVKIAQNSDDAEERSEALANAREKASIANARIDEFATSLKVGVPF
ncbi:hypothetical protein [Salinisphaera sp.]|uniref:hypothetical protein n=1 Tax=Salinisphaera sp. TaxID=1914330 RepID=UPI0025E5D0D0|nr:hypothetical protein [Salinisphaera sp.]